MISNKRMLEYYKQYQQSHNGNICSCYKKPSKAKIDAWAYILNYFYYVDMGYQIKVIAYNAQHFTVGYIYEDVNYNTHKVVTFFKVITKQNIKEIIINVEEF